VKLSMFVFLATLAVTAHAFADSYVVSAERDKNYYQKVTSMIVSNEQGGTKLWINTAGSATKNCLLTKDEVAASGYSIGELQLLATSTGAKDVVFDCYETSAREQRITVKTYFLPNFKWTTERIAPVVEK
jgi:hypothetical protein